MTAYAKVIDGTLIEVRQPSRDGEPKLLDGQIMRPPDGQWTDNLAAAVGFYPIIRTSKPDDTLTERYERSVTLVDGDPTETWTAVAKTQQEQDDEAAAAVLVANEATINTKLDAALSAMQDIIDSPPSTQAQARDAIVLQARVLRALIRNVRNDFTGDD